MTSDRSSSNPTVLQFAVLALCALALAACGDAGGDPRAGTAYVFALDSELESTQGSVKSEIEGRTELGYRNVVSGNELMLELDRIAARAIVDGEVVADSTLSRDGIRVLRLEGVSETAAADATDEQREMLNSTFGTPLVKITLGPEGADLERSLVGPERGGNLIDDGLIDAMRFFHVRFPDEAQWSEERRFGVGNGMLASGKLEYSKRAPEGSSVVVDVSGELGGRGTQSGQMIRNARYTVSGTQTFDLERGEWASGELTIEVSYELFNPHAPGGSATGRLVATLERSSS